MGGPTPPKKAKAKKGKPKPKPKLPMRANAPGRVVPAMPALHGTVGPISPIQGKRRTTSSVASDLADEDALAAKVAADAVTASDAAKRKMKVRERKMKLQKLEKAKKIALEQYAKMKAKEQLRARADARARAYAQAKADAEARAKGVTRCAALAQPIDAAATAQAANAATVTQAPAETGPGANAASNPAAASPPAAAAAAAPQAREDDPMSPTAAIPPLDLAHPSPGTPLPPLPAVPQPMETDEMEEDVEEKKQDAEQDDAVLNHALAAANAAAKAAAVVDSVINTASGQHTQELCAASALAVAAAAAEESRGDDRMNDFHSAVGSERANPPAKGGARRRGLSAASSIEEAGGDDSGKLPEETPKKRGPGRPKKKRPGTPKSMMQSDVSPSDGAKSSQKNKMKTPKKRKEPPPPRNSSTRQRKQPGLYSDDRPGTVTYEEQFGDGKDKGGKKEMVKDPETGEYVMKKLTAKESLAAEGLSDNPGVNGDMGVGNDDMDIGGTGNHSVVDEEDDEDGVPVEVEAEGAKPVGRKLAHQSTAKGKRGKKRSASERADDTSNGNSGADPRAAKKLGPGRPRKNVDPFQGTDVAQAKLIPKGKRTRGGRGKNTANRTPGTSAGVKISSKAPDKEKADETAESSSVSDAKKAADAEKAHNLFISREGKNAYFRVELLIGPPENRVRMVPFTELLCEDGDLSIDSYVATEGQPFALRVKIARPRTDNAVYGGRVYIDKPCSCTHHERNERLGEQHVCGKKNALAKQLNEGMDHFFWIGPGETEYTIEGFYKNQAKSQQFVFAKPTQDLDLSEGIDQSDEGLKNERMMNIFRSIGGIRIAFSLLKKWQKRPLNRSYTPKQAAIDAEAFVERKGKELSAQPGEIVEDRVPETDREALLSDTVVFEKRIDYNTFCGYKASQTMVKYTNTIGLYKGLPIDILKQEDVRKQCVNMYMTQVPLDRMRDKFHDNLEETFKQTHSSAGCSTGQSSSEGAASRTAAGDSGEPKAYSKPDKWVPVQAIVRAICRDLSPAGSYLICTGEYHVDERTGIRNYGETVVQNTEASAEERYVDMEYKTSKLADFFTKDPHIYDSRDCGVDADGSIRYEVCAAVVDLTGNSDDEFD